MALCAAMPNNQVRKLDVQRCVLDGLDLPHESGTRRPRLLIVLVIGLSEHHCGTVRAGDRAHRQRRHPGQDLGQRRRRDVHDGQLTQTGLQILGPVAIVSVPAVVIAISHLCCAQRARFLRREGS